MCAVENDLSLVAILVNNGNIAIWTLLALLLMIGR